MTANGKRERAASKPEASISYYGGKLEVQLGDQIENRFWLLFYQFRKSCRVVYIPGMSPLNREFECDGLKWVGIKPEDDSAVIGEIVAPKTAQLLKRVRFLSRDLSPHPGGECPMLRVLIETSPPSSLTALPGMTNCHHV